MLWCCAPLSHLSSLHLALNPCICSYLSFGGIQFSSVAQFPYRPSRRQFRNFNSELNFVHSPETADIGSTCSSQPTVVWTDSWVTPTYSVGSFLSTTSCVHSTWAPSCSEPTCTPLAVASFSRLAGATFNCIWVDLEPRILNSYPS